ncbi:MAG: hypothetical protein U0572_06470 [Phycisphaerales bacterium]
MGIDDTQASSPGRPRCSNCRHDLTGAVNSSKCPECGKPLVEVLVRDESTLLKLMGRRYTSRATLFGIPAVCVVFGLGPDGKPGHARGWIALGDRATGVIAFGGTARGVVAFGGVAIGILSSGGVSIGLLGALGGLAIAPLGVAAGGVAAGLFASGGMTLGLAVMGGSGLGWYSWGPPGSMISKHALQIVSGSPSDPDAAAAFQRLSWLIGTNLNGATARVMAWFGAVYVAAAFLLGIPAVFRWRAEGGEFNPPTSRPS